MSRSSRPSAAPSAAVPPRTAPIRIVGIETSCDETAVGIVENGRRILSSPYASSVTLHERYGGVIPEIAARAHVETIWSVFELALEEARMKPEDLDAIAVTQGPGLPGALLLGLAFAKGLALSLDRPLVPVDHLAAHLYAGEMADTSLEPPYIGLVVSGGHTLLCVAHADCRYEVLGETRDDAVGEAFDKVAKMLGLGYPGGPVIDQLSHEGQAEAIRFPRGQTKQPYDFSFSGLKTAVYHHIQKIAEGSRLKAEGNGKEIEASTLQPPASRLPQQEIADIAASFQEAAVDILMTKTLRACQRTGIHRVVVGGGVASNRRLRACFAKIATEQKLQVVFPPPSLCVDNGAMVAGIGYPLLKQGRTAPLSITSDANLCLV